MKILRKIRQCIVSSPKRDDYYSLDKQLVPIAFHSAHGDNINLSADRLFAKRHQSFCKAIVFSNRALLIGEEISILITTVSTNWSGSLRFGFSNINPTSFRNKLPRYMCPNLTRIPGCYARALQEEETTVGTVLTFWLNEFGQIMYKINGKPLGVFLQLDYNRVNVPMWAMIDIYGYVTSVKIINSKNFVFNNKPVLSSTTRSMTELNNLHSNLAELNLNEPVFASAQLNPIAYSSPPQRQTRPVSPVSKYYANVEFNRMQLSKTVGTNIKLNSSRTIASRKNLTCNLGYVFTNRPLNINEKLVIQILNNDQLYNGNLGFGLTTCNPLNLNSKNDLPADSHKLLDRNEYWLVIKDVLVNAKAGDELGFTINSRNQVQLTKNNLPPVTLMHVDATQRFWAFFDLHGKTTKIQVLGTFYEQTHPQSVQLTNAINQQNLSNHNESGSIKQLKFEIKKRLNISPKPTDQQQLTVIDDTPKFNQEANNPNGDCTVCFEKSINCVLYQCGHMCMCYDCAMKQWQGVGGQCPICRAYICDVIRTYWS